MNRVFTAVVLALLGLMVPGSVALGQSDPNAEAARKAREARQAAEAARKAREARLAADAARDARKAAQAASEARKAAEAAKEARKAAQAAREARKAAQAAREARQAASAAREARKAAEAAREARKAAEAAKEARKAAETAREARKAAEAAKEARKAAETAREARKAAEAAKEARKAAETAREARKAAEAGKEARKAAEAAREARKAAEATREARKAAEAAKEARNAAEAGREAREASKAAREVREARKNPESAPKPREALREREGRQMAQKQIAKLPPKDQQRLQELRKKAEGKQRERRRPADLDKARAKPAKLKPAATGSGFGLTGPDIQKVAKALGNDPEGQAILKKIKNGTPLTDEEIGYLKGKQTNYKPNSPTATAIDAALLADKDIKRQQAILDRLNQLGGGGGAVIFPDNPLFPPASVIPPGPAVNFPTDPNQPDGPGVLTSVACAPVDSTDRQDVDAIAPSLGQGEKDADPVDPDAVVEAVSPLQTTRYLRIANNTKEPITVWVLYKTPKDDAEAAWYPADPSDPEKALSFELEPGEVTDIADNGWRINASQARIWAKSKSRNWDRFKNQDFWLVPELKDGDMGYYAPDIGTVNFVIR